MVAVFKVLALAANQHVHIAVAVVAGYLLAPTAVYLSVFEGDNHLVVGFQAFEGLGV